MSTFTARGKYRKNGYEYKAPTMFIEASTLDEAIDIAKKSSLGRFDEWSFHVEAFTQRISNVRNKK